MKKPERIRVLGVPVDCVGMLEALDTVESMIVADRSRTVLAVNPEKVMKARQDPSLLAHFEEAGLLIPDGIGVVFAARILGLGRMSRVPGSELMPAICQRAAGKGYKVFLFGAKPEVNAIVAESLPNLYPGINLVGTQHGYLYEGEMSELIARINRSGAEILFIALGSPRQEEWMAKYLPKLNVKVCQGVGGTFDVIAGTVKRAPAIFRNLHLEWFYRLASDPRRVTRQTALPKFFVTVMKAKIFRAG